MSQTPTGGIPTEFPANSTPLDLTAIPRTQIETAIRLNVDALALIRAKEGPAVAETMVEYQALKLAGPILEAVLALATKL